MADKKQTKTIKSGFLILQLRSGEMSDGLKLCDVADAFGCPLPEEHLGSHLQILWVFDELKEDHCFLACS